MPGAETSLQLGLGAMVVEEDHFAMAMLIIAVAIKGFLCWILGDLLDVSVGHCDGYGSRGEIKKSWLRATDILIREPSHESNLYHAPSRIPQES